LAKFDECLNALTTQLWQCSGRGYKCHINVMDVAIQGRITALLAALLVCDRGHSLSICFDRNLIADD